MPRPRHIRTAIRVLDALELIANAPNGLALSQVASGLGITRQSAHSLLKTLVDKKYVDKHSSPARYKLGPALASMRQQHDLWNQKVLIPSIPKLIALSRNLSATSMLSQHVGDEVLLRFIVPAKSPQESQTFYGATMAPYGSALLHQAHMDEVDLLEFQRRHPLRSATARYWRSLTDVRMFLKLVRREGHLCFVSFGRFRAAAPLRDESGEVSASIILTKPFEEMSPGEPKRVLDLLLREVRTLSHKPSPQ